MVRLQTLLGASLISSSIASPATSTPHTSNNINNNLFPKPTWTLLPTNSTSQFRGLSPVSSHIAWVSGTNNTVLRTLDGGHTWTSVGPTPNTTTPLEFRDIEAYSALTAVILSIGAGSSSRIYITHDGGLSWSPTFVNTDPDAFYDCMAFATPAHGLAVSDPVGGKFRVLETRDAGRSWRVLDPAGMPAALSGEAGFAASGTCVEAAAGRWYLASGGVDPGRVFRSADGGRRWDVANSSIAGGEAGGVFSVRFRDARHGVAVGGDFEVPTGHEDNAAWSADGGRTWTPAERFPGGYRSGAAWVEEGLLGGGLGGRGVALAVGPTGSDFTVDGGRCWHGFDNGTFDSVECVRGGVCWASGQDGRVARLSWSY